MTVSSLCSSPPPQSTSSPQEARGTRRHPSTKGSLSNLERVGLAWHSLTKATTSPEEAAQASLFLVKFLIAPCTPIPIPLPDSPRPKSIFTIAWVMQRHSWAGKQVQIQAGGSLGCWVHRLQDRITHVQSHHCSRDNTAMVKSRDFM